MIHVNIESPRGSVRGVGFLPAVPRVGEEVFVANDWAEVTHVRYELDDTVVHLAVKDKEGRLT